MIHLYTTSRLRVLRRCPQEHHFRYTLGVRTPDTAASRFGTDGHRALEAYFKAWELCAPRDFRLNAALAEVHKVVDPVERVKLEVLVVGYDERWGGEPWEILAVEQQFEYQLGAYRIGGKVDAIIRDTRDGRVFVLEHKTTGQDAAPGSSYWEKLTIDTQVSIYLDGAAVLGHDVAGCIYDVLTRPEHERRLATPETEREYTKGKGCKECGGSAGGKRGVEKGRGRITVTGPHGGTLMDEVCGACQGSGWIEEPRLVARHRAEDETIEELLERVGTAVGEAPDRFFQRQLVVRMVDELPRLRLDLQQAIWLHEKAEESGVRFRNPDACKRGRDALCDFFPVCSGRASVDDANRFPRGPVHPELAPTP